MPAPRGYHLLLAQETAALPWELALGVARGNPETPPISVIRQLQQAPRYRNSPRTTERRALLIANPQTQDAFISEQPVGSGTASLPGPRGADREVTAVARILQAVGYDVVLSRNEDAASVIASLFRHTYQIVLIAGNAVQDLQVPGGSKVTGFVLNDGVFLTAAEFSQMHVMPDVVFLNDCHLGKSASSSESGLIRSLVPELLKQGVSCVVAPAWAVDDDVAEVFAEHFFHALAGEQRSFEEACMAARQAAWKAGPDLNTWAAYQAYGDPDFTLSRQPT